MRSAHFTRREWLRLGGGAGLGFLLSPVVAERAYAQAGKGMQRVLFILSQNGVPGNAWAVSEGADGGVTIGGTFAALNRNRAHVTAIDGLAFKHSEGHVGGPLTYLTNRPMSPNNQNDAKTRAQGESVDYFIGRTLKQQGLGGANVMLTTTVGSDPWGGGEFITYEGPARPIKGLRGAGTVFSRVFGSGGTTPAPAAPAGPALPPEWQARGRQSVLDFVTEEYRLLKGVVGPHEARKLDETLTSIRELEVDLIKREKEVRPAAAVTCSPQSPSSGDEFEKVTRVLAEAMVCGETMVATVRFAPDNGTVHSWSHGDSGAHNKHFQWQAEQVSALIDRLKAKPMGAGTLLDNIMVIWCNEIGVMRSPGYHGSAGLPVFIAGSFGGRVNASKLIKTGGLQHSTLLVSAAQGMGIMIDGFGDMNGCKPGPVPGLLKA